MAVSVMFSMSGVDKRRFLDAVKADPQTYADWVGNGEWNIKTSGKEDALFSPFLRKPFKRAVAAGVIPASLSTLAGTWDPAESAAFRSALEAFENIPEEDSPLRTIKPR